jgi:hypothetical protein
MVFVRGRTRRIFSKAAGKSCATATTASFSVSLTNWTRRCSTAVKIIRRFWKQPLAIALDEVGGGRADGDDEIDRPTGIKGAKIFYE